MWIYHDLVKEILDKLILHRPGPDDVCEVGRKKLSDNVSTIQLVDILCSSDILENYRSTNISSRGETKMSRNDITFGNGVSR